jgi:sulfur-oxidizing protein SoxY
MVWRAACGLAILTAFGLPASASAAPPDPLGSFAWADLAAWMFPDAEIVFDDQVKLRLPERADDPAQVPFLVDATALAPIGQIVVLADFAADPLILTFQPDRLPPVIGGRLAIAGATPVRAAALTADGVWHVAGHWVETGTDSCLTPPVPRSPADRRPRPDVFEMRSLARTDGGWRIRLALSQALPPDGLPVSVAIGDKAGAALAHIDLRPGTGQFPVLTFDLAPGLSPDGIVIEGKDNRGRSLPADGPSAAAP